MSILVWIAVLMASVMTVANVAWILRMKRMRRSQAIIERRSTLMEEQILPATESVVAAQNGRVTLAGLEISGAWEAQLRNIYVELPDELAEVRVNTPPPRTTAAESDSYAFRKQLAKASKQGALVH